METDRRKEKVKSDHHQLEARDKKSCLHCSKEIRSDWEKSWKKKKGEREPEAKQDGMKNSREREKS